MTVIEYQARTKVAENLLATIVEGSVKIPTMGSGVNSFIEDTGKQFNKSYVRSELADAIEHIPAIREIMSRLGHIEVIEINMYTWEEDLLEKLDEKTCRKENSVNDGSKCLQTQQ